MAVVGNAVVRVTALKNSLRDSLRDEFKSTERDADAAGERTGTRFGNAAGRSASTRFVDGLDMAPALGRLEESGQEGGGRFGNAAGISGSTSFIEGLDMAPVHGKMESSGHESGARFGSAAGISGSKSFIDGLDMDPLADNSGRAGNTSGRRFRDTFRKSSSGLVDDLAEMGSDGGNAIVRNLGVLDQAGPHVSGLIGKIVALIPLVGVLGGALAALVGAATAMAGAFIYASGSAAILAPALGALVLGIGTAMLAFKGIGEAVKAMGNAQKNAGKEALAASKERRAATRAVANAEDALAKAQDRVGTSQRALTKAQKDLSRARRDSARDQARAARDVEDAEGNLADAQRDAKRAQEDLTRAREDAKEKLEDLQLSMRGAVLGEEEATLRLRKAREEYAKTINDSSATSDDREQARLDLENAELALDQAKDRREDVTLETQKANKAGIEGSSEVVSAKEKIDNANQKVADSERALADARQRQVDTQVAAADRVADAIQGVTDAQRGVADAHKAVADAAQNVADAQDRLKEATDKVGASQQALNDVFKRMSPEAKRFAEYIFTLRGEMDKLKASAGSQLFLPLEFKIKGLVANFLPALNDAIKSTGAGIAQFIGGISSRLTLDATTKNMKTFAKGNVDIFANFGRIVGNIGRLFLALSVAAQPLLLRFTNFLNVFTGKKANVAESEAGLKSMTGTINHMGDVAAQIGHIFGATFGALKNIIKAALPSGEALNGSLLNTLKHFQAWTDSEDGQKRMKDFFKTTAEVARHVSSAVVELVKQFLKLGENKKLSGMFDDLKKGLPDLEKGIVGFTNKIAIPAIKAIVAVVKAFSAAVNSDVANKIYDIFAKIAKVVGEIGDKLSPVKEILSALVPDWVGKALKGVAAGILAIVAAVVILKKLGKITGVTGVVNQVRSGFADPRTDRARGAKGVGAVIQGARGHRIIKDEKLKYDVDGKEVTPRDKDYTRSSRFGAALTGRRRAKRERKQLLGDEGQIRPDSMRDSERFIEGLDTDPTGGEPKKRRRFGRSAKRAGRGDRGSASTKILVGGAAAGAIGLALAPAIMNGKIPGLDKVGELAGKLLTGDMNASMALGMLPMMGGAAKKMQTLLNGPAGPLFENAGSAAAAKVGDKMQSGLSSAASSAASKMAGKIGPVLKGLGGPAGIASKALRGVGLAVRFAMGPVGLIIIGITALVAGFIYAYKHSEKFKKIVDGAMKGIGKAFSAMWDIAKSVFKFLKDHIEIVLLALGPLGFAIGAIVAVFKNWDKIKEIVGNVVGAVVGFFRDLPGRIRGFITGLGSSIGGWFAGIGRTMREKTSDAVTGVVEFFKDLPRRIGSFIGGIVSKAGEIGTKIGDAIKEKARAGVDGVVTFFKDLPGKIGGFVKGIGEKAADVGKAIGGGIKDGILGILRAAGKFEIAIANSVIDAINKYVIQKINSTLEFKLSNPFGPGSVTVNPPDLPNIPNIKGAAKGATILPTRGGTLLRVAEAGKPETVVDTGLINAKLRSSLSGDSRNLEELRRQTKLLLMIADRVGLTGLSVHIEGDSRQTPQQNVSRVLRDLQWQLGA